MNMLAFTCTCTHLIQASQWEGQEARQKCRPILLRSRQTPSRTTSDRDCKLPPALSCVCKKLHVCLNYWVLKFCVRTSFRGRVRHVTLLRGCFASPGWCQICPMTKCVQHSGFRIWKSCVHVHVVFMLHYIKYGTVTVNVSYSVLVGPVSTSLRRMFINCSLPAKFPTKMLKSLQL